MDYAIKYRTQLALRIFSALFFCVAITSASWYIGSEYLRLEPAYSALLGLFFGTLTILFIGHVLLNAVSRPLEVVEQIVSFAADSSMSRIAPDVEGQHIGRELLVNLSRQIYGFASATSHTATQHTSDADAVPSQFQKFIDALPVSVIGLDKDRNVSLLNKTAVEYIAKPTSVPLTGVPLHDVFPMTFQDDSLEDWLDSTSAKSVVASRTWERVKHIKNQDTDKLFDMAVNFSKDDSSGLETIVILFDKTDSYTEDQDEVNFVALAVHELRTPLTVVRGYIEVFEDEIGPQLTPELREFMHKMKASAQQLTAFVSNILNVARVEQNQLTLTLRSNVWPEILKAAISDLELRARVNGKHIELHITEELPAVAADRISIHEVLNNLVDNAIKYSGNSEKIVIKTALNEEGLIETSIEDFGIGIPQAVMGELFQRYHRSHKSKVSVGGTGLGLYLCRAIVSAHGGNIWVRSKEGKGSIFSFTLLPYDKVSAEQLSGEDGITRSAHGWIKNHSLYRN